MQLRPAMYLDRRRTIRDIRIRSSVDRLAAATTRMANSQAVDSFDLIGS
jgi:hypothetical protein